MPAINPTKCSGRSLAKLRTERASLAAAPDIFCWALRNERSAEVIGEGLKFFVIWIGTDGATGSSGSGQEIGSLLLFLIGTTGFWCAMFTLLERDLRRYLDARYVKTYI
jgi:hypothetical protein